ncbi:MAG: DCC1-like thiol-disulfide oxidoreductase family protein [Myxococcales bacterium]
MRDRLVATYAALDPRSLGIFRILIGCVLLLDLWLRVGVLQHWYTNAGLLPNHTLLWRPPSRFIVSLFFTASTRSEALVGFALCALVYLGFTAGYRTRLMQVLTWLCFTSLRSRTAMLENGGDMVLSLVLTWSLFLPLGARLSIDALRASLHRRVEHTAAELADRGALRAPVVPVVSLASFALLAQVFLIYLFNTINKSGETWTQGSAAHYALHLDRMVTPLGVVLREQLPPAAFRVLSWSTLAVEGFAALAIASPVATARLRGIAMVLLPLMHLSFAACLDIGVFSYVMVACFSLLLAAPHYRALGAAWARRKRHLQCFFDEDCGICFQLARVLVRLDVLRRVELIGNHEQDRLPPGVTAETVEATIVVRDRDSGALYTRSDAIAELCRALPLGTIAWLFLRAPGLRALWLRLYDRVAENRTRISQWFGLAACGLPASPGAAPAHDAPAAHGPARLWARLAPRLRDAAVALLLLTSVGEVLNNNPAVPAALRYRQPDALQAIVVYGRLFQGWKMFAPNAPRQDEALTVDAVTVDGRHVDPYNQVASRPLPGPLERIPPRLGNDKFFTAYSLYITQPRYAAYRGALQEWILRHHLRTGDPADRIVRFDVYFLQDDSPALGSQRPTNTRRERLMTYPAPR